MKEVKILFVDDEKDITDNIYEFFKNSYNIKTYTDPWEAFEAIKNDFSDIIIADYKMPGLSGLELLLEAKKLDSYYYGILFTAFADKQLLEQAINNNLIKKIIEKPLDFTILEQSIKEAVADCQMKKNSEEKIRFLTSQYNHLKVKIKNTGNDIIGFDKGLKEIYSKLKYISKYNINVLITGETGTGKELAAKFIHEMSSRNEEPFIDINCSAIPENLFESELFGFSRGAFTDAKNEKMGKLELANGGTLFLDEIGELKYEMQAKLLRAIQEKTVQRLGDNRKIHTDFRLVSATNRNLDEMIMENKFRSDLYYRINEFHIHLPSLRQRLEDIEDMAYYFNNKFCTELRIKPKTISADTIKLLKEYNWPGNIREFENAVKRAIISTFEVETIEPCHFDFLHIRHYPENEDDKTLSLAIDRICNGEISFSTSVGSIKKAIIRKILEKFDGNVSQAVKTTGIKKDIFYTYK
ncbi:MAG: sigma-54-dependent Fis family transcriptional regulator [Spirochaetales bacterium]|nr:sigma-54-dependent Fis family transcriptional regulator [Spirochaetales bacterium]